MIKNLVVSGQDLWVCFLPFPAHVSHSVLLYDLQEWNENPDSGYSFGLIKANEQSYK